jgi:hypothetical protein
LYVCTFYINFSYFILTNVHYDCKTSKNCMDLVVGDDLFGYNSRFWCASLASSLALILSNSPFAKKFSTIKQNIEGLQHPAHITLHNWFNRLQTTEDL